MSALWQLILLFCAGGLGTLSRFGLNRLFSLCVANSTPWGTSLINIIGCLCFGVVAELFNLREHWNTDTKIIVLTGFLGACITFSTYRYELHSLYEKGSIPFALAAFTVQNVIGFAAVLIEVCTARHVCG